MSVCKDENVFDDFEVIISDKSFKTSIFWFTPSRLEKNIKSKKTSFEIASAMLNCYNTYYDKNKELEDLFDINSIKDYQLIRWTIGYNFGDESSNGILDGIFQKIIALSKWFFHLLLYPFIIVKHGGDLPSNEKRKLLRDMIIIFIVLILMIYLYNYISNGINLLKESSNIFESINKRAGR